MDNADTLSYEAIRDIVFKWPAHERSHLVQEVLKTLTPSYATAPSEKQPTLDRALGLLATEQPAPSDAQIQRWLDEHRAEKYG